MADKKEDPLSNYYVIKFEKFIDLITEIESKHSILADMLHEEAAKVSPEEWDETPIPAITELYVTVHDIRSFLEDKINNATEEEVKLAQENNIKDVLVSKEELQRMNVLLLAEESLEASLEKEYKISLATH